MRWYSELTSMSSGEQKSEEIAERKQQEKAELDKLNEAYAKQMQR